MPSFALDPAHAAPLRFGAFLLILLPLIVLERLAPRRRGDAQRRRRWLANFGLVLADFFAAAALPVAAVSAALMARSAGIGAFSQLNWPPLLEGVLAWLVLDCAIYWQHRAMHTIAWLWPLHQPHHSDVQIDVTTALRFHPLEILLSILWKIIVVLALGAPPLAVLVFEITLNGAAMFNHANWRVPGDAWLRALIVTPDMHRVHHSIHREETDSNYGFALSLWDRLFGSYTPQPQEGHQTMQIGLPILRAPEESTWLALLLQPFRRIARTTRR